MRNTVFHTQTLRELLVDVPDRQAQLYAFRLEYEGRLSKAMAAHAIAGRSVPLLDDEGEPLPRSRRPPRSRAAVKRRLASLEAAQPFERDTVARRTLELGQALGLDPAEVGVLDFSVRLSTDRRLHMAFTLFVEAHGQGSPMLDAAAAISVATGLPPSEVRQALRDEGVLRSSHLVDDDWCVASFVMHATRRQDAPADVFDGLFRRADGSALSLEDFAHVRRQADLMVSLIAGAASSREKGIHVLIYGPPGVGKSELARVIAGAAGCALWEVGTPKDGEEGVRNRTDAYRVLLRFLRNLTGAIVLFDEVEDAFVPSLPTFPGFGRESRRPQWRWNDDARVDSKASTNEWLESSIVPTIWVGNAIDHIDPAFRRRFQLTLMLDTPPPEVRVRMLSKGLDGLAIAPSVIERLAQDDRITPAHIATAAATAGICAKNSQEPKEELFLQVLASNVGEDLRSTPVKYDIAYDLKYVRADTDVGELVAGLKRTLSGRVLLHGAPGTGKTALATHVAECLGRRLIVGRASELISKWVGESEKLLAQLFARARDQSAVLLIDEADSLLFPRVEAYRSWEITRTNELLTQMERFEGVLLCATNEAEGLDEAVFRRFDSKVHLLPPGAEQRWQLFLALLDSAKVAPPDGAEAIRLRVALDALGALTPGDFAAVRRKLRFCAREQTASDVVSMLGSEHSWKSTAQAIGFGRVVS